MGSALVGALKRQIPNGRPARKTAETEGSIPQDNTQDGGATPQINPQVNAFRNDPKQPELLADLGEISDAELSELLDAEQAFSEHRNNLPDANKEDDLIEENRGAEALLDELRTGDAALALLRENRPRRSRSHRNRTQ